MEPLGCIGFGGPPTHIKLLRDLCVTRRRWLRPAEFEDAIVACDLLPGPASTQLGISCVWRVRGRTGAVVGGSAFIVPGLILILGLAALVLTGSIAKPRGPLRFAVDERLGWGTGCDLPDADGFGGVGDGLCGGLRGLGRVLCGPR
ncbi:MAG: chromate transporter, partial [Pseudonocardiales bacterium]|nr:chromate transporter [Pseudonocardiales bacterium]